MHDFLEFLLHLLQEGGILAGIAAVVCTAGILLSWLLFRIITKGTKKFRWTQAICIVLLVGYAALVLYATVLRMDGGYRDISLHLFRGWREAWNGFSLQLWLNVLLNVALLVPLGVLLPLLAKPFRKWYASLVAGLAASLCIETVQYLTARGLFDIDDLFNNTLGAVIGYCLVMLCLSFREKPGIRGRRCIAFAAVPLAFILTVCGIFVGYRVQEFGNFRDAPTFTVNTSKTVWEPLCTLSSESASVPVYQTAAFTKESCDAFGADFARRLSLSFPDTYYYDGMTLFANHSTGDFLHVYHHDGSYEYSVGGVSFSLPYAEADEETLRELLVPYGIVIPADARFRYEGNGLHTFTASMSKADSAIIDGTLSCWCREGGILDRFTNEMLPFSHYRYVEILSPAEAYALLCAGHFSDGELFTRYAPKTVSVLSCTLTYQTDTKGFYRPVYVFALTGEEDFSLSVTVRAMK